MKSCLLLAMPFLLIAGASCYSGDDGYERSDLKRHVDRQVDQKDMEPEDRKRLPR